MKNKKHWVSQTIRHQVSLEANGFCYHCKKRAKRADISTRGHLRFFDENDNTFHIDHLVPRKDGGGDEKSNLVLSCPTCNTGLRNKRARNDDRVMKLLEEING